MSPKVECVSTSMNNLKTLHTCYQLVSQEKCNNLHNNSPVHISLAWILLTVFILNIAKHIKNKTYATLIHMLH